MNFTENGPLKVSVSNDGIVKLRGTLKTDKNNVEFGANMTPAEARRLAKALVAGADRAETYFTFRN